MLIVSIWLQWRVKVRARPASNEDSHDEPRPAWMGMVVDFGQQLTAAATDETDGRPLGPKSDSDWQGMTGHVTSCLYHQHVDMHHAHDTNVKGTVGSGAVAIEGYGHFIFESKAAAEAGLWLMRHDCISWTQQVLWLGQHWLDLNMAVDKEQYYLSSTTTAGKQTCIYQSLNIREVRTATTCLTLVMAKRLWHVYPPWYCQNVSKIEKNLVEKCRETMFWILNWGQNRYFVIMPEWKPVEPIRMKKAHPAAAIVAKKLMIFLFQVESWLKFWGFSTFASFSFCKML